METVKLECRSPLLTFYPLIHVTPLYAFKLPFPDPQVTPVKLEKQSVHSKYVTEHILLMHFPSYFRNIFLQYRPVILKLDGRKKKMRKFYSGRWS